MSIENDSVATAIRVALAKGRFFVAPPAQLRIEFVAGQRVPWEIFRGHLVDSAHTRQSIVADVWSVYADDDPPATSPLIDLLRERDATRLYVTRQILVYGHEAYEEIPGVILTRAVQKWTLELVATIDVGSTSPTSLAEALSHAIFLAVIGVSRLPITSLESPLPAYSLGQLGYCPMLATAEIPWTDPIAYLRAALAIEPWGSEHVKAFETCLRAASAERISSVADVLAAVVEKDSGSLSRVFDLFRKLFSQVALAPYTPFTRRLTGLLDELANRGPQWSEPVTDTLSYMLRHLCRHLTAFDLAMFHNFGANYPDALFLDELLKTFMRQIEMQPSHFFLADSDSPAQARRKRLRRRALRQGALVRKHYEGHRVPDAPTSMGENQRVLPSTIPRVPEEQITQPHARRKQLFAGEPTAELLDDAPRRVLAESLADLRVSDELLELGLAAFLARPLGAFKQRGEGDRTPLVAYEAFSPSIAHRRLQELRSAGWLTEQAAGELIELFGHLQPRGVPITTLTLVERPGVVSLGDVVKASPDFVLLQSTSGSLRELFAPYDLSPLATVSPEAVAWLMSDAPKLLVPGEQSDAGLPTLRLLDARGCCRLIIGLTRSPGAEVYRGTADGETLRQMQVLAVGEVDAAGRHVGRDFRGSEVWLKLR